jgi:phage tail-like protein
MSTYPLPSFCFKVEMNFTGGSGEAVFKSVGGIRYETELLDVREGGVNDTSYKLVGATKWSNLVLKQGFTKASSLIKWREEWLARTGTKNRADGKIIQLNTKLEAVATWSFTRGWPAKWELSELDASKSELAIETLEIAHEGLTFKAL